MDKSEYENILNRKMKKISQLLPYSKSLKKNLLDNYNKDILEEIDESSKIPEDLQLEPRQIAEKLAKSQEWPIKNTSLKKRTLAFIIDIPFSLIIGFIFWVLFYQVIILYDKDFFQTTRSTPIALTLFIIQVSVWLYGFLLYPLLFEVCLQVYVLIFCNQY